MTWHDLFISGRCSCLSNDENLKTYNLSTRQRNRLVIPTGPDALTISAWLFRGGEVESGTPPDWQVLDTDGSTWMGLLVSSVASNPPLV